MFFTNNLSKVSTVLFFVLFLSACSNATVSGPDGFKKVDSLEGFNRKVFAFNDGVDSYILRPAAKGYKAITPKVVDKGIGNFFANLDDVGNLVNNGLQGKIRRSGSDLERLLLNTIIGIGGIFDVASAIGVPKSNEDFGQTLATWGVNSGPYLVLPFFGPSTLRDAPAKLTVDAALDPINYLDDASIALFILETVKKRADFFPQEKTLKDLASGDRYSAIRDIWLENRVFLINDGKSTNDDQGSDDLIDDLEDLDDI